eukprot:scaffold107616_cov48-Phaeocystis_antarctica.AAC.1
MVYILPGGRGANLYIAVVFIPGGRGAHHARAPVRHPELKPRTSRAQAGLLLTRLSLASDRRGVLDRCSSGDLGGCSVLR